MIKEALWLVDSLKKNTLNALSNDFVHEKYLVKTFIWLINISCDGRNVSSTQYICKQNICISFKEVDNNKRFYFYWKIIIAIRISLIFTRHSQKDWLRIH